MKIWILLTGGKDGPVGFADFVYKHIVPACFLAPLKQTFDLADAQTVLVSTQEPLFTLCGSHVFELAISSSVPGWLCYIRIHF